MPRDVDKRKTARALRKLQRVAAAADLPDPPAPLTTWEEAFVSGVAERLETYGSAFRDPQKGAMDEPLSQRQGEILRVLARKTRPRHKAQVAPAASEDESGGASQKRVRAGKGFARRTPMQARRSPRLPKGVAPGDDAPGDADEG